MAPLFAGILHMRIVSTITALVVMGALYLFVFERDILMSVAQRPIPEAEIDASEAPDPGQEILTGDSFSDLQTAETVAVVAIKSTAKLVESAVFLRGETQAARQVNVMAETSGLIISEPLRKGARVVAGQTLCQIDPGTRRITLEETGARLNEALARVPEAAAGIPAAEARVAEAQARLSEARARLVEAEINQRAATRLGEGGFASETRVAATTAALESARAGVSAADSSLKSARSGIESANSAIEAAEAGVQSAQAGVAAAEREIEKLTIVAPFGGLLESDTAELGALLQPGALCANIIQLDPIKLVGFVPETEVDRITEGARAGARLTSGREVFGAVTFLSRSADPTTRTFRVEITVPNTDRTIRDGQTAEIAIESDGAAAHLLPQSALTLNDDGILGVRIADADGRAAFAPITLLRDTVEGVLITGLPETADVIVVGQEYVTDGVPVALTYREVTQ